jgi:hypothetical protein
MKLPVLVWFGDDRDKDERNSVGDFTGLAITKLYRISLLIIKIA